jgi:hypothetical protein
MRDFLPSFTALRQTQHLIVDELLGVAGRESKNLLFANPQATICPTPRGTQKTRLPV